MKVRVLVFACGSEIALEVHRSLRYAKEVELFGASSSEDHGGLVYENYIPGLPFYHEPDFIDRLNEVIERYRIDYLIAAYDYALPVAARAARDGKLNCKLLANPLETIDCCASKKRTNRLFAGRIPVPVCYETPEEVTQYPVFLKPDNGSGSKGIAKVDTPEDLAFRLKQNPDLSIFDYLPGKEYTVDCFTGTDGHLLFCEGRERLRVMNGIAVRTLPVADEGFQTYGEIINSTLNFTGPWFFQLKADAEGALKLLEVGVRIAGAMGLYRNLGFNFILAAIYQAEGYPVSVNLNRPETIVYDRALEGKFKTSYSYSGVYLDLDDCLIVKGQLNLMLVQFIYQCIEQGKKITLLTRHKGSPQETLRHYRLETVFDEIIHLADATDRKSRHVLPDTIFIDDSFGERCEVARTCGISVFSPDMVESLLR